MVPLKETTEEEQPHSTATERFTITYNGPVGRVLTWPIRKALVWARAIIGLLRWYSMPLFVFLLAVLGLWYLFSQIL